MLQARLRDIEHAGARRHRRPPWPAWLAAIVAAALALLVPFASGGAPHPVGGQRIDMKVLLIGTSAGEPVTDWQANLDREGIPYDTILASGPAFTDATFADDGTGRAKYQAVILTDGDLGGVPAPSEWAALAKFQQAFGIRQISDNTFPSPAHGLSVVGAGADQGGVTAQLTATGLLAFPYLKGPVPIAPGSFGWRATPAAGATFDVLLQHPSGDAYLGVYRAPDGREEMVMTVASNPNMTHNQLLRHGMINWVTRGVHLGQWRNHFTVNVDDIFLPDDAWDIATHTTPADFVPPRCANPPTYPQPCVNLRMTPTDVAAAIAWQNATGVKLDFVYNGTGLQEARDANGGTDPLSDDAVNGLLVNKGAFRWINHTFTHQDLDTVSQLTIQNEITQNITFATQNGIAAEPNALVTGGHSGLGTYFGVLPGGLAINPNMAPALTATGTLWVGDDNSAQPVQRVIGSARTVPRHPANVYYNTDTRQRQLDEYNTICPPGNCVANPVDWATYVNNEVGIMFGHLMGNDPRPHYVHQANLMQSGPGPGSRNGILYGDDHNGVLDNLLARYGQWFSVPLSQPTLSESGELIRQQSAWQSGQNAVTAYLQDGKVHITSTTAQKAPVTGVAGGELYGGQRSQWLALTAGVEQVLDPADPVVPAVSVVTGNPIPGSTLTTTVPAWTGTAPITSDVQWQKCTSTATSSCTDITGATSTTYVAQFGDVGARIRSVASAGNWIASASQAVSAMTAPVDATPPSVTAEQAAGQADPANTAPVRFAVVFSEPVNGFTAGDVAVTGPAGSAAAVIGSGPAYEVAVSGMTGGGVISVSIPGGAATDLAGNPNGASTSVDNAVTYDPANPTVTINQAPGQPDPVNTGPVMFAVAFRKPVTGFGADDVTLTAPPGAMAAVSGSGSTYSVSVTGMTANGDVIASIPAGAAVDGAANPSLASTSTDNAVRFDATRPTASVALAPGQADRPTALPIRFRVTFSEPVAGFAADDLVLTGPAGAVAAVSGTGDTYEVTVSGLAARGLLTLAVRDGAASDPAGNASTASPAAGATYARALLTSLRITGARFTTAPLSRGETKIPRAAVVAWTVDARSAIRFTIQRKGKNGRWATMGVVTRPAKAGHGNFRFTGRVGGKALTPGVYRMVVQATDGAGFVSVKKLLAFTIVRVRR